jgi:hypothetical protein
MPDWLRAAPTDAGPAPDAPFPRPTKAALPPAPEPGDRIDPTTFLTEDDLPAWIRALVTNGPTPARAADPPSVPRERATPAPRPLASPSVAATVPASRSPGSETRRPTDSVPMPTGATRQNAPYHGGERTAANAPSATSASPPLAVPRAHPPVVVEPRPVPPPRHDVTTVVLVLLLVLLAVLAVLVGSGALS